MTEGLEAYANLQRSREDVSLGPGAAFEVVSRLLALNSVQGDRKVNVVLLSRSSPVLTLRAFKSAASLGLDITQGSFTSGGSVASYGRAWGVDLFLSNEADDVLDAARNGLAAAHLCLRPKTACSVGDGQVRIALDGDSVVFGPESDLIYKSHGLAGFLTHETEKARVPMEPGPMGHFFRKISKLRDQLAINGDKKLIRVALVTARTAPSHERVVHTFRSWGCMPDEAHFVGAFEKSEILRAFAPHIFFDDQEKHVLGAASVVASGLVPGPHDPAHLVIQAAE